MEKWKKKSRKIPMKIYFSIARAAAGVGFSDFMG